MMIDTEIMMGNVKKLPEYPDRDYQEEQNQWIDKELENCFADYCIVGGHHPIYSVGNHGPTEKIIRYLQATFINWLMITKHLASTGKTSC